MSRFFPKKKPVYDKEALLKYEANDDFAVHGRRRYNGSRKFTIQCY